MAPLVELDNVSFSFSSVHRHSPSRSTKNLGAGHSDSEADTGRDGDRSPLLEVAESEPQGESTNVFSLPPVTLQLRLGQIILVGGAIGAGKSTLLAGIAGLLQPCWAGDLTFQAGVSFFPSTIMFVQAIWV